MTSRADDFDVRYTVPPEAGAAGNGRHRGTGGRGTVPGGVDYDLGYDGNGWDTQGFRRPAGGQQAPADSYGGPPTEAYSPVADGYPDELYQGQPAGPETIGIGAAGTRQLQRELDAPRRPGRHGPGGPGGPGGPKGPRRGDKVKIKGSWWRHWTWRKALGLLLSLIGGLVVIIAVAVVYVYQHTPVPTEQMAAALSAQSTVYTKNGQVVGRFGDTDRQLVTYNQIPPQIIYSVLAAEDRSFFSEGGVSPTGILRAAYEDTIGGGNFQGGSTITQQFVRQYYQGIGTQQTASRKVKEIFVSMKIAKNKSKDWILENYLNTIYLGEGANGIGAAVQTYFDIPVPKMSKITWSQSALIAAIIRGPSTYPLPQYRTDLKNRWQYVRAGLLKMGWINQQTYNSMSFPKFGNYTPKNYGTAVWDPYVMNVVQNELEDIYGLTESKLDNGGYKIVTTIDPAKMNSLYQAVSQQETAMTAGGESLQPYMHVGAVLEDPSSGAIEAMYPGPGYPGSKYNGTGKVITQKFCNEIHCEVNMAVYNQEQVGSSFKPYILATAVAQGMNVQTSMLDGQDFVCIPPDTMKQSFPSQAGYPNNCPASWFAMSNDSAGESGAFNAQDAMTNSVNTAYADLWHYVGGSAVVHMASNFGVDPVGSGLETMRDEAGIALGQASLTVADQSAMLAAIDNGGTYNRTHMISAISQGSTQYARRVKSAPVFNGNAVINQQMDSQVQYAMQKVAYSGTAAGVAGMSDGRQIISKTGTTNTAQSAFFIGAIPQQALAVALFTDHQTGKASDQTLNGLGGITQTFGGTWPAAIWHTYAQNEFLPLQALTFPAPTFTGAKWMLAPNNLLKPKKKKVTHKHGNGNGPGAVPTPTAACPPGVVNVDCNPLANNNPNPNPSPSLGTGFNISIPNVTGSQAGGAAFGIAALPLTLLWVRRRKRVR